MIRLWKQAMGNHVAGQFLNMVRGDNVQAIDGDLSRSLCDMIN